MSWLTSQNLRHDTSLSPRRIQSRSRCHFQVKGQAFNVALHAELLLEGLAEALRLIKTHGRVEDHHDKVPDLLTFRIVKLVSPVSRKKERKPDALRVRTQLSGNAMKDGL